MTSKFKFFSALDKKGGDGGNLSDSGGHGEGFRDGHGIDGSINGTIESDGILEEVMAEGKWWKRK